MAFFQVVEEVGAELATDVTVVEDEVDLEVLLEATDVHVGGTDGGHEPVHDDYFAMVESFAILEYPDAGFQQFFDIGTGAPVGQQGIRFVRYHDTDIDSAHGGGFQRVDGGFPRHEIRRGDENVFFRHVDKREISLLDGSPVAVGSGSHGLNHHVAVRLFVREVFRLVQ